MTELEITPEALLNNLEMHRKLAQEASDEILRLRAENEKLRALLEEARGWVDRGESGWQDFVYQIDAAIETP